MSMDQGEVTLGEALERHLKEHGFAPDGGLAEKWAVVRIGRIPLCLPNVSARRRAVPFHDLNHVVSGYRHDDLGEAEVGAWELASGCKTYLAAWILNWSALPLGLRSPRRLFEAFVRGRHSGNLYGADLNRVLGRSLRSVRSDLGLDRQHRATLLDALLFGAAVALAPVVGAIPASMSLITSPLWLTEGAQRRRRLPVGTTP
jgi:hypothetical protein